MRFGHFLGIQVLVEALGLRFLVFGVYALNGDGPKSWCFCRCIKSIYSMLAHEEEGLKLERGLMFWLASFHPLDQFRLYTQNSTVWKTWVGGVFRSRTWDQDMCVISSGKMALFKSSFCCFHSLSQVFWLFRLRWSRKRSDKVWPLAPFRSPN